METATYWEQIDTVPNKFIRFRQFSIVNREQAMIYKRHIIINKQLLSYGNCNNLISVSIRLYIIFLCINNNNDLCILFLIIIFCLSRKSSCNIDLEF